MAHPTPSARKPAPPPAPQAHLVSFTCDKPRPRIGDTVSLTAVVAGVFDAVEVAGQKLALKDAGKGQKTGTISVKVEAPAAYTCEAISSGKVVLTGNLDLHLAADHPAMDHPGVEGVEGCIDSVNADQVLERGDILIKFAGMESSVTEKVIMGGQKCVSRLSGLFHKAIKKGDPSCFHAALYLGKGKTVEAHGGDLKTARVGQRSIDDHGGFLFQVYRCKDGALAEAAAKVGETWGNRRMHYKVPALVPFEHSNYGPKGHAEAFDYAKSAGIEGGPKDVDEMFCSQFVIAVYQAASGARELAKNPKLKAKDLPMPVGIDLHASNSSPLALDAQLILGCEKGTWEHITEVLVRPQHAGSSAEIAPGPDLTGKLTDLGIPTAKRWPNYDKRESKEDKLKYNLRYARNPWQLRAFDGKLFVANGNANNDGPAPNVGPIDLWTWDGKQWAVEYVVQDEQVDVMPVLEGQLYMPGIDSHLGGANPGKLAKAASVPADWAWGNMYHRLSGGKWEQLRTIQNALHVYDLIKFQGQIFAAQSLEIGGTVAHSKDGGLSWREMTTHLLPWQRTRSFFILQDKLYASTSGGYLYEWDGKGSMNRVMCDLFPGVQDNTTLHAARPVTFRNEAVYIAARKLIDHDWTAEGLFHMDAIDEARLLVLPGGALARDLRVIGDKLYILATQQIGLRMARNRLFSTADLATFQEELRFDHSTFARSFDQLGGNWFFGLGCDPEWLHDDTGRILST